MKKLNSMIVLLASLFAGAFTQAHELKSASTFADFLQETEYFRVAQLNSPQGNCTEQALKSGNLNRVGSYAIRFENNAELVLSSDKICVNQQFNRMVIHQINRNQSSFSLQLQNTDYQALCKLRQYRRSYYGVSSPFLHKIMECTLYQENQKVGELILRN